MKKTIFVSGATSGIGYSVAKKFAENGDRVIITGRRADRLELIARELEGAYGAEIFTICFDVRDKDVSLNVMDQLPEHWQHIDILVNNAGLAAGRDSFENSDIEDFDAMIDTNVKGLAYLTKGLLPLLVKNGKAHIINVGSIAGKQVYAMAAGYCASKFAVDAFTKGLRIDLLPHNIKVTGIHPGAVETEFSIVRFKGDETKANAVYTGYKPLSGDDIAEVIFYSANLPAHVCLNDIVITPTAQAGIHYFHKNI
ncbi:SDR family NAD(P)-dependent oxidoreductase [Polluticaenibacter yanchengensis]|uniref:SDR family NAD(P)-dependent oxidoreductase n=1 Tax=Polluticaenibacter yanchengensis TaxID=3014562 RepID=A0ABT4UL18_9BACT|nr:SDR family NAD(P)-dependent oxidoreductase [Chitinophagaceae bacterium LY-5]